MAAIRYNIRNIINSYFNCINVILINQTGIFSKLILLIILSDNIYLLKYIKKL